MSRFGSTGEFFYEQQGNWLAGTTFYLDQGQMPEYPFEEYRVTDNTILRNLNGDAYTFQNYSKRGYKFKWTLLDENTTGSIRDMVDANPKIAFFSDPVWFGTFILAEKPTFTEVQFELYDVELNLVEA